MTSTARLFDLDAPDPHVVAVKLLARCETARRYQERWEASHGPYARALRAHHTATGTVPEFDDPVIRVRCSEIEALAAAAEGEPCQT